MHNSDGSRGSKGSAQEAQAMDMALCNFGSKSNCGSRCMTLAQENSSKLVIGSRCSNRKGRAPCISRLAAQARMNDLILCSRDDIIKLKYCGSRCSREGKHECHWIGSNKYYIRLKIKKYIIGMCVDRNEIERKARCGFAALAGLIRMAQEAQKVWLKRLKLSLKCGSRIEYSTLAQEYR